MNPRTIRWQSGVTLPLLLLAAFVGGPALVLWLAGLPLIAALGFNVLYAHRVGSRGRPERRITGDRWVARYAAAGFGLPMLAAIGLLVSGYAATVRLWDFSAAETAALGGDLGGLFAAILLSSLFDWYYVRPRIDGIVGEPPCRSSGSDVWKRPTRWWYLNRGLATLAYMGFVLVLALILMIMLVRAHPAVAAVIGGVGGLAGLGLIFAGRYRSELPTVGQFVLSPAYCLGDDLSYESNRWGGRGYVLHVAVPVTKLVPLDRRTGKPTGTPFVERKNSELADAELESRRTTLCDGGCAKLNPTCALGLARLDQKRRPVIV